jgi:hypothetical protein
VWRRAAPWRRGAPGASRSSIGTFITGTARSPFCTTTDASSTSPCTGQAAAAAR